MCVCVCVYIYIYIYIYIHARKQFGYPKIRRYSSSRQIRQELYHKYQFLDTQAQNQQITLNGEIPNKITAMHFFQDALTVKIQVFRGRYAESISKQ